MELLQIEPLTPVRKNGMVRMEEPPFDPPYATVVDGEEIGMSSSSLPFIEANTISSSLRDIRQNHVIPSFAKDGEPLISHADFIEAALDATHGVFAMQTILNPNIRLSHEIRGRLPAAKDKPSNQLMDTDKTLFYERMAFVIEIPSIKGMVDGNSLSLMVGGVKSYNSDNLYNKVGADQHFKLFIGFKNAVCTNLCISTDGFMGSISVSNVDQLRSYIRMLFESFDHQLFFNNLQSLANFSITENQFAHIIGRCKMYQHLSKPVQNGLPSMLFGENQLGTIVKDYYRDNSFRSKSDGSISLWKLHNLFTGANKSSYIDSFADRAANAFSFVHEIKNSMDGGDPNWFLG